MSENVNPTQGNPCVSHGNDGEPGAGEGSCCPSSQSPGQTSTTLDAPGNPFADGNSILILHDAASAGAVSEGVMPGEMVVAATDSTHAPQLPSLSV